MRFRIAVNGVTLTGEIHTPARANGGTVVLLHGFTGSAAGWGSHLTTLAAAGWRAIALDLLGHGHSDAPDDPQRYAIERSAADIRAAVTQLGAQPDHTVLLGYSLGGRIALHAAHGGGWRGLILESASPGLDDPAARGARVASDEALADRILAGGVAAFVAEWEALPLFAGLRDLPPERQAALHAERLANRAAGLAGSLRGVGTGAQPPQHAALPDLRLPVLVIAGERDAKFVGIARAMAAVLPEATLDIIPGAGHTVHHERPAAFDAALLRFLTRVGAPVPYHPREATTR